VVEIHNKSTYDRIYNKMTEDFITFYCRFRSIGHSARESLQAAKIQIQSQVALDIVTPKKRLNARMIIMAYKNLNKDTEIVERAIKTYRGIR
jgi:hypothetical protein